MAKEEKRIQRLAVVSAIVGLIVAYRACRNRHSITRKALVDPQISPWRKLLYCGDDGDFLEVTGLTRRTFGKLHEKLFPNGKNSDGRVGRKSLLTSVDELGMYLHFINSTMKLKTICQLFGVTQSTASVTIRRIRRLFVRRLLSDDDCSIRWPTFEEQQHFASLIERRERNRPTSINRLASTSRRVGNAGNSRDFRAFENSTNVGQINALPNYPVHNSVAQFSHEIYRIKPDHDGILQRLRRNVTRQVLRQNCSLLQRVILFN